jgi:hypothetical protein
MGDDQGVRGFPINSKGDLAFDVELETVQTLVVANGGHRADFPQAIPVVSM